MKDQQKIRAVRVDDVETDTVKSKSCLQMLLLQNWNAHYSVLAKREKSLLEDSHFYFKERLLINYY